MLPVAINYKGVIEGKKLGSILIKLFNDFKMIKLYPGDDPEEERLQLCQPEGYEDLLKYIQESWNPSKSMLELRGPRVKLQRAVRHILFFDEEKKYEKAFLEGCDGITDFPWAVQIFVVQLPVLDLEQETEWIQKAEIIVLNDAEGEESRDFAAKVKLIRPDIPFFIEQFQEGLSKELQDSLEDLFDVHLKKRRRIKEMLQEKQSEQLISCEQAHRMAGKLGVSLSLVGSVCDELGYRIVRCGLGCF